MFQPDNIVGEIADPQGRLQIGNVGDTECVCLSYSGAQKFSLVYTGREVSSLLAAAKKAAELTPTAKPRSTVRLAALPPKPVRLQVVLAAPEGKAPVLILRFLGPNWKQDVFTQAATLVDLLQRTEKRAPMPGVVGILDRFGATIWMIEGQSLEVSDELSHGTGFYGEYIHHKEVPEGQVVRSWATEADGKKVVVAFEYAQTWEPSLMADQAEGQRGDQALSDGLVRQSREVHAELSKQMFESQSVDPVWAAKITLTSILGDIIMSDDKAAGATWSGQGGNPILQTGIQTLKEGNVSPHDAALFSMITSYFHSKFTDPAQALGQINAEMSKVWNFSKHNAPEMAHLILNNWALFLKDRGVKSGAPELAPWQEAKASYKPALKPTTVCFPDPYPWVRTWQPAKTGEPKPAPPPEREIKPGPVQLPPVQDRPVEDASPVAPPQAADMDGDTLEESGPFKGMDDPHKRKKKKSPLPLVLAGLVVVGAGVFFATRGGPEVENTPTPTPTVVSTPVKAMPTPTPEMPKNAPLPPGNLLINGFALDGKLREGDLLKAGYKVVETYEDGDSGIARYEGPGGRVIATLKLPARQITALQGDALLIDSQKVADLETEPKSFEGDERFSKYKITTVIDGEGKVQAYVDSESGIYVAEPLVSSGNGALTLSRKIKDNNFYETLPQEFVNSYYTDGNPVIFHFLGSFETDRLRYLLEQGADPNQKSWVDGGTALHACDNVTTAKLLLSLGADPSLTNSAGQTPAEVAGNDELKRVLAVAPKATATPAPTTTPEVSPTPEVSTAPEASPLPESSPTPVSTP